MVSSEERREVAERLREALGGHVAVECSKVAHALGLEYETHGMMYCFGSEEVRRLADLIDPARGDVVVLGDALAVEALEYIYALESALVQLSSEGDRKKIVSLMCAVRERFAPRLSEKLYDWTKDVAADANGAR